MNLRLKFVWSMLVGLSFIAIFYFGYNIYQMYIEKEQNWSDYQNEEIGTDKRLQKQVEDLEANLNSRESYKFSIDEDPTNLMAVVDFAGLDFASSLHNKKIRVTYIYKSGNTLIANIQYRGEYTDVKTGDSIAGGLVTSITDTELTFEKEDKVIVFSLNPNQELTN
jgi:hypothetical protein